MIKPDSIRRVPDEPGVLKGTITIYGKQHHIWAFQIATRREEGQDIQSAVGDPQRRFCEYAIADNHSSPYETVKIRGYPGSYAVFVTPFQRG